MIDKVLSTIGNSKTGQKFFKWASQPKSERFLNQTVPQIETVITTGCYMISTAIQKDIDDDRKDMLQIQHATSGLVGLAISSKANKKISEYGEEIIKNLDKNKIQPEAIRNISKGLRVGLPIATTAFCMRFLIPSVIALFSGKVMDKVRDKREHKLNKLS